MLPQQTPIIPQVRRVLSYGVDILRDKGNKGGADREAR